MRLIFITRKVDRGDALTGFIFTWIEKLSSRLKKLDVICQEKGDISGLPGNVEVHSFGKERGFGRLRQGYELFVISYKLARKANGFFIHMHPIYAITAWLPAKFWGRKIILWYTHKSVDFKLRVAHALVDAVFTASKESFRLNSNKVRVVGHGIDLNKFKVQSEKLKAKDRKFRTISIGRISPVKDYETLIKAMDILVHQKGMSDIEMEIYGRIGLPKHQGYLDGLVQFVRNANLEGVVKFQGELNYEYVDEVYGEADLFVNSSQTGSIDKTVLEAAASGIFVLTSNEAFFPKLKAISPTLLFARDNPHDLADKLEKIKAMPEAQKIEIRDRLVEWVRDEHNLENLAGKVLDFFRT